MAHLFSSAQRLIPWLVIQAAVLLLATAGCVRGADEGGERVAAASQAAQAGGAGPMVDGGGNHSLVLRPDGAVWAFGSNSNGQLGDATTADRNMPVEVQGLSGVRAVSGGGTHTLALGGGGEVWAFGANGYGQLGDGTTSDRLSAQAVPGLGGVTAVWAGGSHSLALLGDGTVRAWGSNAVGQLGDGTLTHRLSPVGVLGLTGVVGIAAGELFSVALLGDGTVRSWGRNDAGQLGDGTKTNRLSPVAVVGLTGVTAIAAGRQHALALRNDGTVWGWGYNVHGQVGDGTTVGRTTPVQVQGLAEVTAVAAGRFHSLALRNDGTVWGWGQNTTGQVGDGTLTNRSVPVQVVGVSGAVAIGGGTEHSLALGGDGTVWVWGRNQVGQLGNGTTANQPAAQTIWRCIPNQPVGCYTGPAGTLGVGACHAGTAMCNALGTGQGACTGDRLPAAEELCATAEDDDCDGEVNEICVCTPGQTQACYTGPAGTLGVGVCHAGVATCNALGTAYEGCVGEVVPSRERCKPAGKPDVDEDCDGQLPQVPCTMAALAGGWAHSIGLLDDGTVWTWGANAYGQLGVWGAPDIIYQPVQVVGLSNVAGIAAGDNHSLAVLEDGTVWAWGSNSYGSLGTDTGNWGWSFVPAQVQGLTGVVGVAARGDYSLAVKQDGTVWAWGSNLDGQLGNGLLCNWQTFENCASQIPVQVLGLTDVVAVFAGLYYSVALKQDGTVWAWGGRKLRLEHRAVASAGADGGQGDRRPSLWAAGSEARWHRMGVGLLGRWPDAGAGAGADRRHQGNIGL